MARLRSARFWRGAVRRRASQSFGVRAGVSGDPDQFFFGGHFETEPADRRT